MKEEISLKINRFTSRGWGLGAHGEKSVEVIGALPGDELAVRLLAKRRKKWRGDLLGVIEPSEMRVAVRCAHAALCGGCTWQQMDYMAQLKEKEDRVRKSFGSLMDGTDFRPIIACDDPWQYRNKMEFSFSQNKAGEKFLGLIIAGSKGHVLNLSECHLVSPWFTQVLCKVRDWWEKSGLAAYRMNDTGTLRTLVVREGKRTGDKLVMLTVSGNPAYAIPRKEIEKFVAAVRTAGDERLSIFLRVQQVCKGAPTQFYEMHLSGPDHLLEKLQLTKEMTFKISPTSFFQPNTLQAEKLYRAAIGLAGAGKRHVLDLYAGTATLGMALADRTEKVTAIEINPHACFDAEVNKELNGISNVEIVCGDVGKKLAELNVKPDLVVVDPPRSGLDGNALAHLKVLQPEEILYVSCNHETQAANIQEMSGYQLAVLQPVDQFPHTPHIENIALLRRILP